MRTGGESKGAGILGAIVASLRTVPWGSLGHVFLLIVGLLLVLVSWRLYGATNKYVEAAWDEALDLIAEKFGEILEKHGPSSIGAFSSARCSNEENFLLSKFVRTVFKSNNVDCCARV